MRYIFLSIWKQNINWDETFLDKVSALLSLTAKKAAKRGFATQRKKKNGKSYAI